MKPPITIFWFRRDLRLYDNRGLFEALKASENVLPLFIFDDELLDPLPRDDHRVSFIYDALTSLQQLLNQKGSGILVKKGRPIEVFSELINEYVVESVFCNGDHEPYGIKRDEKINYLLASHGISFYSYIDHLVFGKQGVLKPDGTPYMVFTPYSRQWKSVLKGDHLQFYASEDIGGRLYSGSLPVFPSLERLGLSRTGLSLSEPDISMQQIKEYHKTRDFPAMEGTTRLGPHLRFGTVSIRGLVKKAIEWNEIFLNELIWREFYAMILWHYPHVVDKSFKPEYDRIRWRNDERDYENWKSGNTGFPMVDAGMRQLNATGYMHNRLRMVTASFLCKHLLVDWRWGEAYFAEKLFDYELSSNNGGWQWSAGTGCDAAPYFRIFNPTEQQKKFDPEGEFIRKWIPELDSIRYTSPIVDHKMARERCLRVYKEVLH